MLIRNTLKVAALYLMVASMASAQIASVAELPKQNFERITDVTQQVKTHLKEKMNQQGFTARAKHLMGNKSVLNQSVVLPLNTTKNMPIATRGTDGEFGAYYTKPSGVYTIKPGLKYSDTFSTGHGFLAPFMKDVIFKDASTGADYIDWYVEGQITYNEKEISVMYLPGGSDFYVPTPELTATSPDGTDSIYQYGYYTYIEKKENGKETEVSVEGQAITVGSGYVHNLHGLAESFANTWFFPLDPSMYWAKMLFGTDLENKSKYVEIFEKPISPVAVNSVFFYVASTTGMMLDTKEFYVTLHQADNDSDYDYTWMPLSDRTKVSFEYMGTVEDGVVWLAEARFDKPLIVDKRFSFIIEGPQDGTAVWAILFQADRELGDKCTACYIPEKGSYAGMIVPYPMQPEGYSEPVAFPASLDLSVEMIMPFNILFDKASGQLISYSDTLGVYADGMETAVSIWNWEAYNGQYETAQMTITSDSEWLSATIDQAPSKENILWQATLKVDPIPDGVAERIAILTLTDGLGYTQNFYIIQNTASGVGVTTAKGYKAAITGETLSLAYPEVCDKVTVYNVSSQVVCAYELPSGGAYHINTSSWGKGIYLIKFEGNTTHSIKVVK